MRDLSIYVHIPFCAGKCRYCDFLSYPAPEREKERYLELLLQEIEKQSFFYKDHRVISVFIGGGTPSFLHAEAVERIIEKLKHNFIFENSCEITIEANPDSLTNHKLSVYFEAGINRISIGLQSADDALLRTLGRIHDSRTFLRAYEGARQAGFRNINIDLMSAVPGQTPESYGNTLEYVLALKPEHISAYSLILEEGTWFYEHRKELHFPTEEEDRALYEMTGEMLESYHYNRYEISNYALEGYECRHNQIYWTRGDYVGFGLGAASMVCDVRWSNRRTMREYEEALRQPEQECLRDLSACRARFGENVQYLSRAEQMEEFMFLGLRLIRGVSRRDFQEKFGLPIEEVYGETLHSLRRDGLLFTEDGNDSIRLTPYGLDISNYAMAQFLFE